MSFSLVVAPALVAPPTIRTARPPLPPQRALHWFAEGWRLWRRAPVVLTAGTVACLGVACLVQAIPEVGPALAPVEVSLLGAGLVCALDRVARGGRARLADLFAAYHPERHLRLLAVSALALLVVAFQALVGYLLVGPAALALFRGQHVPAMQATELALVTALAGLVPATLLMFATPLVLLAGMPVPAAVVRSVRWVLGAPAPLTLYLLVAMVLVAFALLGGAVTLLFFVPWLTAVGFAAYRDVQGRV